MPKSLLHQIATGISRFSEEVKTDFEILGELGDDWEEFKTGIEYEGFLVRRKL